jgi:hypothetical protein
MAILSPKEAPVSAGWEPSLPHEARRRVIHHRRLRLAVQRTETRLGLVTILNVFILGSTVPVDGIQCVVVRTMPTPVRCRMAS